MDTCHWAATQPMQIVQLPNTYGNTILNTQANAHICSQYIPSSQYIRCAHTMYVHKIFEACNIFNSMLTTYSLHTHAHKIFDAHNINNSMLTIHVYSLHTHANNNSMRTYAHNIINIFHTIGTQNAQNYDEYPATTAFLSVLFLYTTNKMVHILETVCV